MPQRSGAFVGCLLLAPEYHRDVSFRVELDHHVGSFVGDPDVVLPIDFHAVRVGPGVEPVADLAQELAIRRELEKLRGAGGIGWSARVATRENENVSLGIDRHASNFAEIHVRRKLQEFGHRLIRDLRNIGLLGLQQSCGE